MEKVKLFRSKKLSAVLTLRIGMLLIALNLIATVMMAFVAGSGMNDKQDAFLNQTIMNAQKQVEQFVEKYISVTEFLAGGVSIQSVMQSGKESSSLAESSEFPALIKTLQRSMEDFPDILGIGFGSLMEDYLYTQRGERLDVRLSSREYYETAKEHTFVTEPYVDSYTGELCVSVTTPVKNGSSAVGAKQFTKKLDVAANNLANINTHGFHPKTAAFSQLVQYNLNDSAEAQTELQAGAGARLTRTWTDFSTSGMVRTDSEYDYAIQDDNAFFMLQDPESGEISFTRDGHFHRAEREDGFYLMTDSGKMVLDQNQMPLKAEVTDVERLQEEMEDGWEESYDDIEDEEEEEKPVVGVYTFENPSRLVSLGDNEYIPADEGMEAVLKTDASLVTGALESSGTDMAKEMVHIIESQQAFRYALKMVTVSDEIETTVNSLRG